VSWEALVCGKSVHAASNPEGGISSAIIAARAISDITAKGYFGRISKGRITGTANVGRINGGEADNQVMDSLVVTGECRSHSPASLEKISKAWKTAFEKAARGLKNDAGESGFVKWSAQRSYPSFKLKKSEPVVKHFLKTAERAGQTRGLQVMSAGLDANILNEKGIPTITFGAGGINAHSLNEQVELPRFIAACKLAVTLATAE